MKMRARCNRLIVMKITHLNELSDFKKSHSHHEFLKSGMQVVTALFRLSYRALRSSILPRLPTLFERVPDQPDIENVLNIGDVETPCFHVNVRRIASLIKPIIAS